MLASSRKSASKFRLAAVVLIAMMVSGFTGDAQANSSQVPVVGHTNTVVSANIESIEGIKNFERVNAGLLRGAAPSDDAVRKLASRGVKTIVDLRHSGPGASHEEKLSDELGIEYVHIPLGFGAPEPAKVKRVLAIINNPEKQPVFLHCRQGADRTGMLVGMYRMIYQGWNFEPVYEEMRRHHFKPWLVLMKSQVKNCLENEELDVSTKQRAELTSQAELEATL